MGLDSSESRDRIHSCLRPSGAATSKTSLLPSGDRRASVPAKLLFSGGKIWKRITSAAGSFSRKWTKANPPSASASIAAAASAMTPIRGRGAGIGAAGKGCEASSSSCHASPISRSRRLGSFSRQRFSRRCTLGGIPSHFGSSLSTVASVSVMSSPSNNRRPVSISYSTTPKAQMSARLSTTFPRACSGDM